MSKRKLLLADDSITIQKVVNLTFADEDIEVITVGDGDAAMRKFIEIKPDLVMADVNMPGLDGYQICETIKQNAETKHIPVVLLVGSFEPFDEERARKVGANDFLTKPFQSIRQLVNKVSDLFDDENTAGFDENVVDSFADTLESIPKPAEANADENISDAGMDDEMIQTNQIGSLPLNEPQKFSSGSSYPAAFEDTDIDSIEPPYDFAGSIQSGKQTEPQISSEEQNDDNFPESQPFNENSRDFESGENSVAEDLNDELEQILKNKKKLDAVPEDASVFALDDFDLLELPQSKKKHSAKNNRQYKAENVARQDSSEFFVGQPQNKPARANNFPPEIIEAIADKVVEKLSSEVVARIVREVVAQMEREK